MSSFSFLRLPSALLLLGLLSACASKPVVHMPNVEVADKPVAISAPQEASLPQVVNVRARKAQFFDMLRPFVQTKTGE